MTYRARDGRSSSSERAESLVRDRYLHDVQHGSPEGVQAGIAQPFEQLADLLDGWVERFDPTESGGFNAVQIVDMAQGQQVIKRVEFSVQSPGQWRREGQVVDQTLDSLQGGWPAEQMGR